MPELPRPRVRRSLDQATIAIAAGRPPRSPDAPLVEPPVFSSTYHAGGPIAYARDGNPTWSALETALGALDGGSALSFASGMGAITAVLETLPIGALVVAAAQSYSATRVFLEERAAAGRLRLRLVDIGDTESVVGSLGGAALLWTETVTNPLNVVADLAALAGAARAAGVISVCDATFSTPYIVRPLDHGIDVVVHSATKFLSGHSDVVLGAVITADSAMCEAVRRKRSQHGAIAGPMEAWLALRGLRTLGVRMDRSTANAHELATRLRDHPLVERVRYPGLPDDPWHDRARALMVNGFGAMLSFDVSGGAGAAEALCTSTELIVHATSLGGVESTIERRRRWPAESPSTPENLVRLSVGCEHVDDLWDDLLHALRIAERAASGPSAAT